MLFGRNFVFCAFVVGLLAAGIDVGRSSTQVKVHPGFNCTGFHGIQRLIGIQGSPGIPGRPGIQGNPGFPGRPGIPGNPGIPGHHGKTGSAGPKGEKGDRGLSGPPGKSGPSGPKGSLGLAGPRGLPGPRGIQGPKGATGYLGEVKIVDVNCSSQSEGSSAADMQWYSYQFHSAILYLGIMRYNKRRGIVEFCDGSNWTHLQTLGIGKSKTLPASSCWDIAKLHDSHDWSGPLWIKSSRGGHAYKTFCDAKEGWTLIMKINGARQTFTYDSALWTNKETFNEDSTAMDDVEAKFASYWKLPFTELRLGMKIGTKTRWTVIRLTASSLYSLIADGKYRSTNIGRSSWRSLLQQSSLQTYCNQEGFNVKSSLLTPGEILKHARARIGLVANQENSCSSPDSFIGFGTSYINVNAPARNSAGNFAWGSTSPDNGHMNTKTISYIMAR